MNNIDPVLGFEQLLRAFESDLLEVTDEEILALAAELGINPLMKGTSALFGVTALTWPRQLGRGPISAGDGRRAGRRRKDVPPR